MPVNVEPGYLDLLHDQLEEVYLHYMRHCVSGCCTCDRYPKVIELLMKAFGEPTKELHHNAAGAD